MDVAVTEQRTKTKRVERGGCVEEGSPNTLDDRLE